MPKKMLSTTVDSRSRISDRSDPDRIQPEYNNFSETLVTLSLVRGTEHPDFLPDYCFCRTPGRIEEVSRIDLLRI